MHWSLRFQMTISLPVRSTDIACGWLQGGRGHLLPPGTAGQQATRPCVLGAATQLGARLSNPACGPRLCECWEVGREGPGMGTQLWQLHLLDFYVIVSVTFLQLSFLVEDPWYPVYPVNWGKQWIPWSKIRFSSEILRVSAFLHGTWIDKGNLRKPGEKNISNERCELKYHMSSKANTSEK